MVFIYISIFHVVSHNTLAEWFCFRLCASKTRPAFSKRSCS